MNALWIAPFALQGALMAADELWFHRARGLGAWERLGHPLDTASVLACLLLPWFLEPTPASLRVYVLMAALSCLLVTKDEIVHASSCRPAEHWIHAVLFVLHPVALAAALVLWAAKDSHALARSLASAFALDAPAAGDARLMLAAQGAAIGGFLIYQIGGIHERSFRRTDQQRVLR